MIKTLNNFKTAMLLGGLFALLVWVGSFWGLNGMIGAAVIATLMNVGAWFFSDRIALASMRAQEVDERTAPELVGMVRRLAERANLPMPRVCVCPQDVPNAFATGRSPRKAAVAVTQGAVRLLDRQELEGVMAHELAHVKNRDTLTSCIAATVAGIFSMLAQGALFFGAPRSNGEGGGHPLAGIAVILLGSVGAALIQAMISRSREYVADADGAAIAGSPDGLMSALRKLDAMSRRIPLETPNPAMNQMFIVEPFCGASVLRLFATHPPTEERIAALMTVRPGRTVS